MKQNVKSNKKNKFSYKNLSKKGKVVFWIVAGVFLFGFVYSLTPEGQKAIEEQKAEQAQLQAEREAEKAKEAEEKAKTEEKSVVDIRNENVGNMTGTLRYLSEEAIKGFLKAPSTAKFQGMVLGDWDGGWASGYENLYYVTSYVDSQNSFGVYLRSDFQVGFKFNEDGTSYEIVWVILDGTVYLDNRK